jgi:uracil-DNA glycosylase
MKDLKRRAPQTILEVSNCVTLCKKCPELREYGAMVASTKRKAYRNEEYWGRPVPCFGDPNAQIMLVGLAPGAHGSHRTGRMFTGDSSGDFLYPALYKVGLASQSAAVNKDDGMRLINCIITSASRCAPPNNKPTHDQLTNCHPYLLAEFDALARLKVLVALGSIGFEAIAKLVRARGFVFDEPKPKFEHAGELTARMPDRVLTILSTYHPSRQNTNTNRLTAKMIEAVFKRAVDLCKRP